MPNDFNPDSADAVFSRILTKLESMENKMGEHHTEIITITKDHETRLGKLEGEKLKRVGFIAGVSTAGGSLGHLVTKWLSGGGGSPPAHH